MMDLHAQTTKRATKATNELKRLFDGLGNTQHPRGAVLSAYRRARQALRGATDNPVTVRMVLDTLRRDLSQTVGNTLAAAADLGVGQAVGDLNVYNISPVADNITAVTSELFDAWLGVYDAQANGILALALTGSADEAMLLGGEDRLGMLSPVPVINEGTRWLALAAGLVASTILVSSLEQVGQTEEFVKQAIAAVDHKTTDCCLRVHGQTVGIKQKFKLTGTPRFADEMDGPPFHYYCRTATALVPRRFAQDDLTREMRSAARAERDARETTRERVKIWPSHARSRRK